MDNANWLKNVYASVSAEGQWSTEARDVVTTTLPPALIMGAVSETSL